jgi:arylsulfatase A-like enzyme
MIVITADHGENMGERGIYNEHSGVYDGTQRIPLIIRPPKKLRDGGLGELKCGSFEELIYNIDLQPTLCDLLGIEGSARWQGESLVKLMQRKSSQWRDHLIVTHGLWGAQRGVRTPEWSYIKTYHPGVASHFEPIELYHIPSDRHFQNNVAGEHSDQLEKMEKLLDRWLDRVLGPVDPADAETRPVCIGPFGHAVRSNDPFRHVVERNPSAYMDSMTWTRKLIENGCTAEARTYARIVGLGSFVE